MYFDAYETVSLPSTAMNSAWPRVLRESDYDRWLEETNSNEARIKDVKVAASYSWEVAEEGDNDNPTIVYPVSLK